MQSGKRNYRPWVAEYSLYSGIFKNFDSLVFLDFETDYLWALSLSGLSMLC